MKAFKMLNDYMESGIVETVVYVSEYMTLYYGNEMKTSTGSADAYSYTWGKYREYDYQHNTGETWGGSSALWYASSTPNYIQLYQTSIMCVSNSSYNLNVGWPSSLSVTNTASVSTANYTTGREYNQTMLGCEHPYMLFDADEVNYGIVTSFKYYDSADIKVGTVIYRPATIVKFITD